MRLNSASENAFGLVNIISLKQPPNFGLASVARRTSAEKCEAESAGHPPKHRIGKCLASGMGSSLGQQGFEGGEVERFGQTAANVQLGGARGRINGCGHEHHGNCCPCSSNN